MSETVTESTAVPAPAAPPAQPPAPRPAAAWLKPVATGRLPPAARRACRSSPAIEGIGYLKVAQYVLIGAVGGIGLTLLVGQAGQLSLAHPFFLLVGGRQLRGAGR